MEKVSLHLLVILLVFSHFIISSNAVPSTRSENLLDGNGDLQARSDTHQTSTEDGAAAAVVDARINLELNDYPGSGANNRHTPKAPLGN